MPVDTTVGYAALPELIARMTGDEKHAAAAHSTLDVLWVLYDRVLNVTPDTAADPERDRFLLSKGHGPQAYYAVLAAKGFLDPALLADWNTAGSPLGGHPDRALLPAAEIGSGSLGHGLPIALGVALGLRAQGRRGRTFVLVGDAELEEGSNVEAIQVAARFGLAGLTAVVVDNASARLGWPGGIDRRFAVEGWTTRTVDGHDHDALAAAFATPHDGPLVVVATVEPKN